MKNIAFVIPSLAIGGAERVVSVLSNYLSEKKDIQIHIILLDENIIEYEIKANIIINYISFNKKLRNPFKTFSRIIKIRNYLKKNKIETVISFLTSANILTILSTFGLKKKIIVSERSDPSKNCLSKKIEIFRNLLYHFSNIIICQTEDAKNYFSKSLQSKIKVIVNPVKCDLPQKVDAVFDNCIVTAARLQRSKNLVLLLKSFFEVVKKYPELILKIYGVGPEKENLIQLAQSLNITNNVLFLGNNPDWQRESIHSLAFVISSDYEGMSNSLIEAMTIGIPCISTDHPIGGARYLIENYVNGILVPVENKDALAQAIFDIIENEELRLTISNNSKKIVSKVNIETIAEIWWNCII